ncbi:MAG: helix-hairpin-helix domain-containing protein [Coriobacteriales bacterium]|jgi:competence protein ComEA|nr:helix-hairpin-helix domain-containing protein [Coriobacteriales bacterium]
MDEGLSLWRRVRALFSRNNLSGKSTLSCVAMRSVAVCLAILGVCALLYFVLLRGSGPDVLMLDGGATSSGLRVAGEVGADNELDTGTQFDQWTADTKSGESTQPVVSDETVVVYMTGEVAAPGLYRLEADGRIGDAVSAAGGLTEQAAEASVNLAEPLVDGSHIHILSQEDYEQASAGAAFPALAGSGIANTSVQPETGSGSSGLVNINSAGSAELQTLDGIGPATAQKIIDYRTSNGPFKNKEELKNVTGIGDKKYAAIASSVTV